MPLHVCNGATLACTFGLAPGTLTVPPLERVLTGGQPAATVMDHRPLVNVSPFGLCASPANPQVIAATAAALGVLTPQPCVPMIELTVITDCSPVMALCPPWNTAISAPISQRTSSAA